MPSVLKVKDDHNSHYFMVEKYHEMLPYFDENFEFVETVKVGYILDLKFNDVFASIKY